MKKGLVSIPSKKKRGDMDSIPGLICVDAGLLGMPTIHTTNYAMSTMSDTVLGPVEFNTHIKKK